MRAEDNDWLGLPLFMNVRRRQQRAAAIEDREEVRATGCPRASPDRLASRRCYGAGCHQASNGIMDFEA